MLFAAALDPAVVQLALRHSFTADSLSLQMKLPSFSSPAQQASSTPKIAFGVPVIEVTAITSIWAVNVLGALCQVCKSLFFYLCDLPSLSCHATLTGTHENISNSTFTRYCIIRCQNLTCGEYFGRSRCWSAWAIKSASRNHRAVVAWGSFMQQIFSLLIPLGVLISFLQHVRSFRCLV